MGVKRFDKTLGDYVAIAIGPALIMTLVGSLVFFLIEILYRGGYPERLQHVFACFIFAAVLIARIAMYNPASAAGLGTVLGISALVCLNVFVEFPKNHPLYHFTFFVNIAMLAIIAWCSYKLTWDCTYIDENQEAGGEGLLDAAGLQQPTESTSENDHESTGEHAAAKTPPAWYDRWFRYLRERQNRPHTPGVWVVYFSLAALPLFGLGQMMMTNATAAQRSYVFWLLAIYVASGLGLLLATTYLGLRRYLRQRKLKMPASMTAVWLALGGGLILALLGVGMILPRPSPDSALSQWMNQAVSPKLKASKNAILRDGAGKGEGNASKNAKGDPEAKPGSGQQIGKEGNKSKPGQDPSTSGKGNNQSGGSGNNKSQSGGSQGDKQSQSQNQSGDKRDSNQNQSGDKRDSNQQSNQGQGGKDGQQKNGGDRKDGDNQQAKNQSGEKDDRNRGGNQSPDKKNAGENNSGSDEKQENNSQDQDKKDDDNRDGSDSSNNQDARDMFNHAPEFGGTIASILKWIVIAIGVVIGGYFLLKALANFMPWARGVLDWFRNLWESLFGGQRSEPTSDSASTAAEEAAETPPAFASFGNPFLDGRSTRMTPEQLVRYSFAALESWAWEQHMERKPEETPLEFVERLGEQVPKMEGDLKRLGNLYAFVAYAQGKLAASNTEALRQFWQRLEQRTPVAV